MRPTEVQGIWGQYEHKRNKFYGGWINRFSPRATVEWYKTGESIGIYSVGVNTDGSKSGYKDALESKGVALIGTELDLRNNFQQTNTVMPKVKTKSSAKKRFKLSGTGKIRRKHAYKSHILTKKETKQKRNLTTTSYVAKVDEKVYNVN